jgi:ABC-type nitrate/sulfonate/bicarbonate transport system permease component
MTAHAPSTAVALRSDRRATRLPRWAQGLCGLVALAVILEVLPRVGAVSPRFLPPFSDILRGLAAEMATSMFWFALYETLRAWAIGLAIAVVAGVGVGLLIGSVPLLRDITSSTIEFLRPIPSVALIPLAVLLFGTDIRSKLMLIVYAAFWQVLIQVLYGVQDVDPVARDTASSYRFSPWARLRFVVWPTALPYVMTGFRLAAAVALILAVTGELVIGSPGLGKEIALAQSSGAIVTMYALVMVAGLIGVAINLAARRLERRVLAWHPSVRGEVIT